MSGTLPNTPRPRDIKLINDQPILSDIAESGKSQDSIVAGHVWRMRITYSPMDKDKAWPLFAFCAKQRGASFQVVLPSKADPRGVATGTPLINGIHTAGDFTIATKGWTVSTAGIMKAGDIWVSASHTKVYMLAEDASSDVTGNAVLTIVNPLVENLADNEGVTVSDVPFTVKIDGDPVETKTTIPNRSSFSVDVVEKL